MTDPQTLLLTVGAAGILGYVIARLLQNKKIDMLELACSQLRNDVVSARDLVSTSTLNAYKNSEEFKALLALHYQNGVAEGGVRSIVDCHSRRRLSEKKRFPIQ